MRFLCPRRPYIAPTSKRASERLPCALASSRGRGRVILGGEGELLSGGGDALNYANFQKLFFPNFFPRCRLGVDVVVILDGEAQKEYDEGGEGGEGCAQRSRFKPNGCRISSSNGTWGVCGAIPPIRAHTPRINSFSHGARPMGCGHTAGTPTVPVFHRPNGPTQNAGRASGRQSARRSFVDEAHQGELLTRFEEEGLTCEALIS